MPVAEALIVSALRTAVGGHGGSLADVRADDLAAIPLKAVIERTGFDPASIDDVILGWKREKMLRLSGTIILTTTYWRVAGWAQRFPSWLPAC